MSQKNNNNLGPIDIDAERAFSLRRWLSTRILR